MKQRIRCLEPFLSQLDELEAVDHPFVAAQ